MSPHYTRDEGRVGQSGFDASTINTTFSPELLQSLSKMSGGTTASIAPASGERSLLIVSIGYQQDWQAAQPFQVECGGFISGSAQPALSVYTSFGRGAASRGKTSKRVSACGACARRFRFEAASDYD
jgi:hypothetical protein